MQNLTEIEYYVTHTYRSIKEKDPMYDDVVLLHPFRAALTETASILAMPTVTTPEILVTHLEEEVQKVKKWTHTPKEYCEQILARYQEILEYITGQASKDTEDRMGEHW